MMTISNDAGYGPLGQLDPFSEGAGMLLKAMTEELNAPAPAVLTDRRATIVAAYRTIAARPQVSTLRAYLEAAAARFDDPRLSTVIRIKPAGRCAFAA